MNPKIALILSSCVNFFRLKKVGGLDRKLVEQGERWRLFSCMFLHSGVVHLLFNTLALLSAGIQLEEEFGFCKNIKTEQPN